MSNSKDVDHFNPTLTRCLFKFLTEEYAKNLINSGEVRVSSLSEFRDEGKYGGKTFDPEEGVVRVHGTCNADENIDGLIEILDNRWFIDHVEKEAVDGGYRYSVHFKIQDLRIHCTSSMLFSESMIQAVEEGKKHCVMILNPDLFYSDISQKLGIHHIGTHFCSYEDRDFHEKHNMAEHLCKFLEFNGCIALQKPKSYASQYEVRSMWWEDGCDLTSNNVSLSKENIKAILIDFSKFDVSLFKERDPDEMIKITIKKHTGRDSYAEINRPFEMLHFSLKKLDDGDELCMTFPRDENGNLEVVGQNIIDLDLFSGHLTGVKVKNIKRVEIKNVRMDKSFRQWVDRR